ncbi:MAG: carboxypeptidase regulatory-like domain-containing protein, partial [Vicinamibacterales bacterium]
MVRLSFVLALGVMAADTAAAQTLYGGVVGVVRDAQGAVVPGVSVTIVNRDTNLTREATTDAQGTYNFVNVLPGPYDVKAALQGFSEAVRTNVPVTTGQVSRVDVTLQVGDLTETLTVSSSQELLQTDTAEVRTDLKSAEITNLPLNRFRNYQALIVLVPGSLPPAFQNAETDTPQRSLNMTVNGQSGNANTTLTDGATNTNLAMPHHTIYVPPAETIDTVSITTGSMDAETGRAAGAAISVITKSGTNTFKGSAFEFFNNDKLNSRPYYFGRGAPPTELPIERQTFGGTLGGPIRRNHLFFFGSYEGYLSRLEQFTFFSVPDAALRNGDFRNALNTNGALQRIYDPMSANLATATAGRQQFPDNVIPATRIHPIAQRLVGMYPLPNVEGTGAGGLTNNYRTVRRDTTDRHNFDVKVNWNRTSAHQIWTKFSRMNAFVSDLFTFPIGSSDDAGGDTKVSQLTAGQTWTLSPTLLLDSSFGASFNDQVVTSPDFGLGMLGLELGIPGTNDQGRSDARYAGMPSFSTGFTALGNTPTWSPIFMDQKTFSFNTNLTMVAGAHDLKG